MYYLYIISISVYWASGSIRSIALDRFEPVVGELLELYGLLCVLKIEQAIFGSVSVFEAVGLLLDEVDHVIDVLSGHEGCFIDVVV